MGQKSYGKLSARQKEVLRLFDKGLSRNQIAEKMKIPLARVQNFLNYACNKMLAANPREAVQTAKKIGQL